MQKRTKNYAHECKGSRPFQRNTYVVRNWEHHETKKKCQENRPFLRKVGWLHYRSFPVQKLLTISCLVRIATEDELAVLLFLSTHIFISCMKS